MARNDSRRARRDARLAHANAKLTRVDAKLVGESTHGAQAGAGAARAGASAAVRAKTLNYVPVFILTAIILIATAVFAFSISQVSSAQADNSAVTGAAEVVNVYEEPTVDGGVAVIEDEGSSAVGSGADGSSSAGSSGDADAGANAEGSGGGTGTEGSEPAAQSDPSALTAPDECVVTINYLEYMNYDDEPDAVIDESGRRVLGTRTLTGLHEGDVLNAWDYVLDLPGHFFFDGWPLDLTVTTDPAQNTMDLIYVKLWDSEYTVNYYVMLNADLSADTWSEALAPDDVEFVKMGSQTFDNQRFDALIKGDAYEYKLDDMYVIDTYPAEIRLGTDPDNNVINVLYTPDLTNLPDDIEVPEDVIPPAAENPDGSSDGGTGGGDTGSGSGDTNTPGTLPDDATMNKDDLIATLPDSIEVGDDSYDDFLGSDIDRGELEITDDMLANPVNKEQAEKTIDAYMTGIRQGSNLAKTGEGLPLVATISGAIAIVALIILISYLVVSRRRSQAAASEQAVPKE